LWTPIGQNSNSAPARDHLPVFLGQVSRNGSSARAFPSFLSLTSSGSAADLLSFLSLFFFFSFCRWIKFEEKVEEGGERWSKPHVTTLSLHSLFELRTFPLGLNRLMFSFCAQEKVIAIQTEKHTLRPELSKKLQDVLLRKPRHQTTKSQLRMTAEICTVSCSGRCLLNHSPCFCPPGQCKIPAGTEVFNVLVGEVDFLDKPFVAFVRLQEAVVLGALTEVAFAIRFLFILLGPRAKVKAYHEIGRSIATLLTDELFQRVALRARGREDLIAGIDEFLDELTVLPPGKWDPTIRITPPKYLPSPHKRSDCNGNMSMVDDRHTHGHQHTSEELKRTGRLFGGLIKDIRRKAPWLMSDFYDALNIQCLSAILYIYLATVTNAITFGGMLGDATDNMQVSVRLLPMAFSHPSPTCSLTNLGLFPSTRDYSLDYLEFRLWIGLWVAFFGLILVATEASYLVQYFTRFTEEGFCALISFIFIYDAIKKMLTLSQPSLPSSEGLGEQPCFAGPVENPQAWARRASSRRAFHKCSVYLEHANWTLLTKKECLQLGGHLVGNSCNYVPYISFMSFILFLGTFLCSMTLKNFKTSRYFPTALRKMVSDFSIILAILIFCGIDAAFGLETPKLIVPSEFKPTNPERGWVVFPFGANPWWVCLLSAVPAVLVIILIFMDQQITAVILNRKEYKLQKGAGFHLDFFCVSLLMILTSVTGLPWYVSATVISLAHMDSLKKESTTSAPGEQPKFLGIREQRLTGLVVFILTGLSVFLAPVLKYIPMPVLYGIFLYMGVATLSSIQFMDRVQLLLMPAKHQPDFIYLRHVPLRRVHLFTFIQMLCLAVLWVLKSTVAAIIFPLMLLALVGIRKAMECIFSLHDLSWLDDIMPDTERKEEEKNPQRKTEQDDSDSEDSELMYQEKGPEINISVN
uniref:Anion exchange protein n=1 Tax=Sphenodon punctatus TaxID=8508 RepID=A0A8D0H926_SPHPU